LHDFKSQTIILLNSWLRFKKLHFQVTRLKLNHNFLNTTFWKCKTKHTDFMTHIYIKILSLDSQLRMTIMHFNLHAESQIVNSKHPWKKSHYVWTDILKGVIEYWLQFSCVHVPMRVTQVWTWTFSGQILIIFLKEK
jgi:hypothetical protein